MRQARPDPRRILTAAVCLGALTLASCAGNKPPRPSPVGTSPSTATLRPYQINGVWYYPRVQWDYDQTGIASWYGPNFHGKRTSTGEVYDMDALTAAHKTLQLPVNVRVTNLENGRALTLRVNDRGPFVNGRIIDVSRKAAQLLGFSDRGTAKVRVQVVDATGRVGGGGAITQPVTSAEERSAAAAAPVGSVAAAPLSPPSGARGTPGPATAPARQQPGTAAAVATGQGAALPAPTAVVSQVPVRPTNIYIQAGAFLQKANADRLAAKLSRYGQATVTRAMVGDQWFLRVRIGPFTDEVAVQALLDQMIAAGEKDARIVVE